MTASDVQPFWHGMVAGGSSGVISRLFTYPPDTVKSRLQVQGTGGRAAQYTGTVDAFARILRAEGVPGLYRGFGAIVLTVVPANMCYFSGYELGKRITPRNWGTASDLMTATIAQTVAGVVFCPIDIIKQRVQTAGVMGAAAVVPPAAAAAAGAAASGAAARPSGGAPAIVAGAAVRSAAPASSRITAAEAVRSVWSQQGVRGFYRGFYAMNALWLPWNLIYLSLYEASKRRIYYWKLEQLHPGRAAAAAAAAAAGEPDVLIVRDPPMTQVLPTWAFPLCSSTCAAIAAVATHPVDVVKTRLQVLSAAEGGRHRRTALGMARELYAAEGGAGFTRGMAARVATLSVGSTISWFVYEMVKRHLGQRAPPPASET